MRAGRLRHVVQLQSRANTPDGAGGNAVAWTTYATEYGNLQPVQGGEVPFGQRVNARFTHTLSLRYRSDVTTEHRVLFGARVMQIRAVRDKDGRTRETLLDLEEGVAT